MSQLTQQRDDGFGLSSTRRSLEKFELGLRVQKCANSPRLRLVQIRIDCSGNIEIRNRIGFINHLDNGRGGSRGEGKACIVHSLLRHQRTQKTSAPDLTTLKTFIGYKVVWDISFHSDSVGKVHVL